MQGLRLPHRVPLFFHVASFAQAGMPSRAAWMSLPSLCGAAVRGGEAGLGSRAQTSRNHAEAASGRQRRSTAAARST